MPKKTQRTPEAKRPPAKSTPLVDKKLKAHWEQALARYRQARAAETASWDDRYEALGEILDSEPALYLAGGFRTAGAFLAAEAPGEEIRTVRRYIRVARHFAPADEARFGISKLDGLLDYLEATGDGAPLPPAKLDLARQRVRVVDGGASRAVPFADATVDELQRARRAAQGTAKRLARAKLPPIVHAVKAALAAAKLRTVSVGVRRGALYLGDIPLTQVPALARALAKVKSV